MGDPPELSAVLGGLARYYAVRGEVQPFREIGEQFQRIAQGAQDPGLLLGASVIVGSAQFFAGELPQAREHLECGLTLYDTQRDRSQVATVGQDVGIMCHQ